MAQLVTIFPHVKDSENPKYCDVYDALRHIWEGRSQALVEQIRTETDKAKRQTLKQSLVCVCFSGRFLKRKNEAQVEHSGYIVLDFDDAADPAQLKKDLFTHPFVKACWLSPSGTGVKCLVRVSPIISQHRGHFAALEKLFQDIDASGKDEARICYESYDPDLLFRNDETIFEDYEVPNEAPPRPGGREATGTDYAKLNQSVLMIRRSVDGSKHETLLRAARLAGGYIASGAVVEDEAVRVLENEVRTNLGPGGVEGLPGAYKTIRDGLEYGKRVPISDQTPEEQPAQKTAVTHSIKFLSASWEAMKDQHKNGKKRGVSTRMPGLDGVFSWKAGELTLGSGYPNSGKSEWFLQLALLMAVFEGWKWAVFSPEAGSADEFYDGLIHSLVGRSTDPAYTNQMSLAQYAEAAEFVMEHFFYIYPDTDHTIEEIESNFVYCIREFGCQGVILDPYNGLSDPGAEREDRYLSKFLTKRKRFAVDHQINYVLVAHPKGDRKVGSDGEYPVIGYYDLAGGAMWGNKVDNFIVVRRPLQETDAANTTVDVHVKKIKKQRLVGIPGIVRYSFERGTNRYMKYNAALNKHESPLEKINSNAIGKKTTKLK